MYTVQLNVTCASSTQARSIKRMLDYAAAGLYYNKAIGELLSSEIVPSPEAALAERKAMRKPQPLRLVPKPKEGQ